MSVSADLAAVFGDPRHSMIRATVAGVVFEFTNAADAAAFARALHEPEAQ